MERKKQIAATVLSLSKEVKPSSMAVPKFKDPFLKRPMDVILSTFMLILSLPVSLLIALAIKMEDGSSILYGQERWGRNGNHFRAYKFRTMAPNSDRDYGIKQASENDSRITKVGRILRAMGLDELPQLLSIFKGDMSFVGKTRGTETRLRSFWRLLTMEAQAQYPLMSSWRSPRPQLSYRRNSLP